MEQIPYRVAWQWQQQLVAERKRENLILASSAPLPPPPAVCQSSSLGSEPQDVLLLLQHLPVYTLGQAADSRFVRFDMDSSEYEVHRVERGGEVTYHCPGQLVGYPILNLRHHRMDLHWYLRQLEEVIIRTMACYGLLGDRRPGLTGVWIENRKVAAIGIKVSRWITMHGFSLNVCPDLTGFARIVPCGLEGKQVGSLEQFLPGVTVVDVQKTLTRQFEAVFQMKLVATPLPEAMASFGWQEEPHL